MKVVQSAEIVRLDSNGVWVRLLDDQSGVTQQSCGSCDQAKGCSSSLWLDFFSLGRIRFSDQHVLAVDQVQAALGQQLIQVGQRFTVEHSDPHRLLGACFIFGIPWIGILFGLSLGLGMHQLTALHLDLCLLLGLGSGLWAALASFRRFRGFIEDRFTLKPVIRADAFTLMYAAAPNDEGL